MKRGDESTRRMIYHSDNGRFREQFNRIYGFGQGATDVTWIYAAIMDIAIQRGRIEH